MDEFGSLVGHGITSLVWTAFDVIGGGIRGIVAAMNAAVPFGLFPVAVFLGLLGTAWFLAKR